MRAVEVYGEDRLTYRGQVYPVPCVVEDDDGVRMLLAASEPDRGVVARAAVVGAAAVLWVRDDGVWWAATDDAEGYRRADTEPGSYRDLLVPAPASTGFCHLHAHSEFSALDGLSSVREMVEAVAADNQPALAVTDHGVCAAHPHLKAAAQRAGIIPIYGIEAYFVPDRVQKTRDYQHLVLWAMNEDGLRNLWAASTEANRSGFYYRPRMDWDILTRYHEGLLCSTACLRGPLAVPLVEEKEDVLLANLARLRSIFGDDLFIEVHTNRLDLQRKVNEALVSIAYEHSVPIVAVSDSHYPCADDKQAHKVWLAAQTNKDLTEDADLFEGDHDYHLMTADEVATSLGYLGERVVREAMATTLTVAESCRADLRPLSTSPGYTKGGPGRDVERLVDLCLANWDKVRGKAHPESDYADRFEREMGLLIDKGFCWYFLVVADYVRWAKGHGVLVGPGRGSGGGSLVAYLADITEIDPVDADLLFERFLTEGREALPDFDVDFPTSRRDDLVAYVTERWGAQAVVRVGTHIRLKNKGVVRDMARVLKSAMTIHYPDIETVAKLIDQAEADKAGLGMPWEDLWEEQGDDLAEFRDKYPTLFDYADRLVGRLKTYGRHAAGYAISTEGPLTDRLPLRMAGDDLVVEFDMEGIESLGLVKFDLLNLRTLDTIQMAVDLVRDERGDRVNVYGWKDEYRDPQVWGEISDGHTLGIFQIETAAGTKLTRRFHPQSLSDLADVITLVRPGPMRSGLTETYLRRREQKEEVTYPDPRLEPVLRKTYGCILYQEDVMAVCMTLGGYSSSEADEVRKILGKKKVQLAAAEGRKFVERCVERGMEREAAQSLWAQMEEFARYCVTGDTQVSLAGSGRYSDGTVTVEEMFRRLHTPLRPSVVGRPARGHEFRGPCDACGATESVSWTRGRCNPCIQWYKKFHAADRGLYALAVHADGRIRPARILDVIENGVRQVWRIMLADGRSITATGNHRHLTERGFLRVDELVVGDRLVVDGGYERHRYVPSEGRTTIGERQMIGAIAGHYGQGNWGWIDGGHARLTQWTAEAPNFCEDCGHDGSERRLERAHLDGDRTNNDPENLRMLCVSCHKRHDYAFNGRRRRWEKGHLAALEPVMAIEAVGQQMTYDVVMEEPHNFIANGIATSNSFNRAHAYGYAVLGHWTAWLKFHYPVQFLVAALSTVKKERIPAFVDEARRMGYRVLPPDVNESGHGFCAPTSMTVRYGLDSVKGIGPAAIEGILHGQPYESFDDFLARRGQRVDMGMVKILAQVGAFDRFGGNRRRIERWLEWSTNGEADRCALRDDSVRGPNNLPCTYDWSTEPPVIGKSGKPLKAKPLPLRCSKACRQFRERVFDEDPPPYTDAEIRDRERDLLGVYLSSTPFDLIDPDDLAECLSADALESAEMGDYLVVGTISRIKLHTARNGKQMAFLGLYARDGEVDVTVFSDLWGKFQRDMTEHRLCFAAVRKNSRGLKLLAFQPV